MGFEHRTGIAEVMNFPTKPKGVTTQMKALDE